jgi:hypothetical protein
MPIAGLVLTRLPALLIRPGYGRSVSNRHKPRFENYRLLTNTAAVPIDPVEQRIKHVDLPVLLENRIEILRQAAVSC